MISTRLVRELKGAPLSCLLLLGLARQPVSNDWLCRMSGYSGKTVAQAMALLSCSEYQMARRAMGGWILTDGTQLVLGEAEKTDQEGERRKFSVSAAAFNNLSIKQDSESLDSAAGRNFSALTEQRYDANMAACKAFGIFDSVAEQISAMEHVTPELIEGHVRQLDRGEGRGLAIVRIRNNEPLAEPDGKLGYDSGAFDEYLQ